jgi:hypothetical protein
VVWDFAFQARCDLLLQKMEMMTQRYLDCWKETGRRDLCVLVVDPRDRFAETILAAWRVTYEQAQAVIQENLAQNLRPLLNVTMGRDEAALGFAKRCPGTSRLLAEWDKPGHFPCIVVAEAGILIGEVAVPRDAG